MRFILDFFLFSVVIFVFAAFLLHSQIGLPSLGSFFRYSGVDKVQQQVQEEKIQSKVLRSQASDTSAEVAERLDRLRDNQAKVREDLERRRSMASERSAGLKESQSLTDKTDTVRRQFDAAQERAQAQRQKMTAQKERLERLTGH